MEQTLKIYIYMEGERPIFHQPQLNGIYASEGWFMKQLQENKHFITSNPNEAHLFYLPFSSHILQETLYVPNSHSRKNLVQYLSSYVKTITETYPFWNRTDGSDHFLVACHDWVLSPLLVVLYINYIVLKSFNLISIALINLHDYIYFHRHQLRQAES